MPRYVDDGGHVDVDVVRGRRRRKRSGDDDRDEADASAEEVSRLHRRSLLRSSAVCNLRDKESLTG